MGLARITLHVSDELGWHRLFLLTVFNHNMDCCQASITLSKNDLALRLGRYSVRICRAFISLTGQYSPKRHTKVSKTTFEMVLSDISNKM